MSELGKIIFSELRFYSPQHPAGDIFYRFEIGLLSKAKFCEIMAEHLEPIIKQWAKSCALKESHPNLLDGDSKYSPTPDWRDGWNSHRRQTCKNIEEG